ncbi:MAG: extracellular solute-binding protein family 1 [Paenibacillaceae bacterium]|jgi:hypothetical protein|nr:extracellular solute-binding protein family 1 [Paenibacillaceae bacterium]
MKGSSRKSARKLLLIPLALSMGASVLSACSKDDSETKASTAPSAAAGTTSTPVEENPYKEKIVFTMSSVNADKAGLNEDGSESANLKWLKEKFNIDFEWWPLTWSNNVEQTRIWLNSDSAPEIIYLDVAASRYSEYLAWVDAGLFKPYNLDKYPNLTKNYEKMGIGKKYEVNGKLYAWPSMMDMSQYDFAQAHGYMYRKDWAKAVGLYKEGDLYTWDEWWKLVDAVIKQDPGKNGAGNTIGIMAPSLWQFPKYITGYAYSPYLLTFKQESNGSWVWGPTLPESLEAVKKVKEFYDAGYIWADQPMVKAEDYKNNFAANRLFAVTGSNVGVTSWSNDFIKPLEAANPGIVGVDAVGWATVKGPDGKLNVWQAADMWSQTAMSYKLSDKKAERWQAVLDYLVTDEGYNFRTYGIKGVDWDYDASGKVVHKWKKDKNGNYVIPYPSSSTWPWSRPATSWDGFALLSPANPEETRAGALQAYKYVTDPSFTKPIPLNADFAYFTSAKYAAATAGLEASIYEKIAELMSSKDIEGDWQKWVAQKAKEVQPAIDELNANVKLK